MVHGASASAQSPGRLADFPNSSDPALTLPLPPLNDLEVRPEGRATSTQAEQGTAAPRYALSTAGLADIGLDDEFRQLSVLEKHEGEESTGAQIDARIEEDIELIQSLLRSRGYYGGRIDTSTSLIDKESAKVRIELTVAPGKRYRFESVNLKTPDGKAAQLIRKSHNLSPGDPITPARVEAAENRLLLELPQNGYPFATLGPRDIVVDDARHVGDYTLPVRPGPRAVFGRVRLEGDTPFSERHANVIARFDRGDLFDSRLTDDLRSALTATGLLSGAALRLEDTGRITPGGDHVVDIVAQLAEGPPRTVAASAGYGTDEGFRLEALWRHRNLFPPEGALTLRAVAGTREQRLAAELRRANAGKRDRTIYILGEAAHEAYDAYDARTLTLRGQLTRESTPIWQKRWTYAVGAELVASDERDRSRDPSAPDGGRRSTFFIGALPLQLGYDATNSLLNPTRGFRLLGKTSPEVSLQGGTFGYLRTQLEGSGYLEAADQLVIAARARAGSIFGAERRRIAPSRRFYAGGGGSVRGFGFQELGPKDANGDPLGGRSLAEFSLEARYRFGSFGVVSFVDGGQLYTGRLPTFGDMRFGVGVGGRYYTDFGPVRVDIARPVNRRPGEPTFAVYVSIGQAF